MEIASQAGIKIEFDFDRDLLLIDGVEMSPEILLAFTSPDPEMLYRFTRRGQTLYVTRSGPGGELPEKFISSDCPE